jgi:hypothetical protein
MELINVKTICLTLYRFAYVIPFSKKNLFLFFYLKIFFIFKNHALHSNGLAWRISHKPVKYTSINTIM